MSTFKDLDRLLQGFTDSGLPGCTLHVTQRGKLIYEGCFGWSDIENRDPVTERSVFRMASMSKLPLYTVMMMLYERGKYLMTEPVGRYLPEWTESKKYVRTPTGTLKAVPTDRPMLIEDVLTMKCGLPYCNFRGPTDDPTVQSMQECMKPLWEKGCYTVREHVAAMSKAVLAFEPGTHWLYGFSSEITAALIEALCDKPIDEVFREMLFDPLGMDDTRSRFFGDIPERMVKLYARDGEGKLSLTTMPFDSKHLPGPEHEEGWARLFSTGRDFSKLMGMLANGGEWEGRRLMGRKTIDMMRANGLNETQLHDFRDAYNAGYGYGYGVRTLMDKAAGDNNGSFGAFGWTGGFGTWCEADPEDAVSIVYMHNMMPNMEQYYHPRVRNAVYGCLE